MLALIGLEIKQYLFEEIEGLEVISEAICVSMENTIMLAKHYPFTVSPVYDNMLKLQRDGFLSLPSTTRLKTALEAFFHSLLRHLMTGKVQVKSPASKLELVQ